VRLWYTATGASVHHLAGHESSLRALAFSPDGRTLASADEAGDGRLWAMAGDEPPTTLAHFGDGDAAVTGLHFSPDGRTLATGHRDRTVRLRDSLTGQERATLTGHTDGVLLLQFAAGVPVNRLLSLAEGGEVKFWRAWAGE
jgi:WD40 repeat protein